MARGVRSNAVMLPVFSQGQQPQSLASYDAKTRRNTILIAEIVPTMNLAEAGRGTFYPSDRYYGLLGPASSYAALPLWLQTLLSSVTLQNYDSSGKQFYVRIGAAGAGALYNNADNPIIWRGGVFGTASSHAPKNAGVAACWIKARVRFPTNADYGTYGMGAGSSPSNFFGTATDHFIQVTRNAGNWELGSCDGSTISQSASAGGADGNFHDFWVRWADGELKLYVDGDLVITKTTNIPERPLCPHAGHSFDGSNPVDIVDYLIEWEAV